MFKSHPLGANLLLKAAIGCSIAGAGLVDNEIKTERTQNPVYALPAFYCESSPLQPEESYKSDHAKPFAAIGGIIIRGTVAPGVDGVRVRYQKSLSNGVVGPVRESAMLPLNGESYTLRLHIIDSQVKVLGITAITALDSPGQPALSCSEEPMLESITLVPDIENASGNHIDPTTFGILFGTV